ncbi:MAG TPA: GAF domain-containing protein, partial [Anaerolineae bacterium]|nr:GAF domain-containing protein [Anaerolineae bacterium]
MKKKTTTKKRLPATRTTTAPARLRSTSMTKPKPRATAAIDWQSIAEQRAAELAIINSVQEGLAAKLDMQAIYDLVGDEIHKVFFEAQVVDILTYDSTTDLLHPQYVIERGVRYEVKPWPVRGFRKHVISTGQPLLINKDIAQKVVEFDNPEFIMGESTKSWLGVPMLVGREVKGVISLQHIDKENAFSESDVRLLSTLAASMSVALENARLFDEVQKKNVEITESLEQQTATSEVLRVIANSPSDIQPVLDAVAENAARVCGANDALIFQVEGNQLRQVAHYGPIPVQPDELALPINRGSAGGRAVVLGDTIHIHDILAESDSEFPISKAIHNRSKRRTLLATPLMRERVPIGVIAIRRTEVDPFTDKQIALLKTFADQAVIAIENVRLFDETQRLLKDTQQRAAELAIINSVQQGLASKLDMQAIYDLVGDKIQEIFDAQIVVIGMADSQAGHAYFPYAIEQGTRIELRADPTDALGDYLRSNRQPLLINMERDGVRFGRARGPKSFLTVPMYVGEKFIGAISLQNADRENAFSEADVRLLATLASSMSVALENARLFDETQRLLKETDQRAAELSIINSVQEALASKLDMQGIYDAVGDKVSEIFPNVEVGIRILDPQTKMVHFAYAVERGQRLQIPPMPLQQEVITKHVLNTRLPLLVNENLVEETQQKYGAFTIPGTQPEKSALWVPLIVGSEGRGLIELVDMDREHAFSDSDVRLLTTVANSMSVALENARLFDETQRLLKETDQRVAELQIINSIQQGLAAELDFQAIVDLVGDKLREVFNTGDIGLNWFDEKANLVHFLYTYEHGKRLMVPPQPPAQRGIHERLAKTRKSWVLNTAADLQEANIPLIPGTDQCKSMVAVPVISGDRLLGTLQLENHERENAYGESELRLLTTIAASLGTALENARLFDETQRLLKITEDRAAELAIINSVQAALAAELNIQGIYDAVGDKIREIFHQADVGIRIYDPQTNLIHFPYLYENGKPIAIKSDPLPQQGFGPHVIRTRETLVINENMAQAMEKYGSYVIPGTEPLKAGVYVPLVVGDQARALIQIVDTEREHVFSESDVRLLQTLANSMSVALENARLFDETQRLFKESEQRAAELAIINSVQAGLASKLDMQSIYDLVGDKIREIFAADTTYIAQYNSEAQIFHFPYYVDKGQRLGNGTLPLGRGLTSAVFNARQPLLLGTQAEQHARGGVTDAYQNAAEDLNQTYLGVPILIGGEVRGVISVQRYRQNSYDETHVRLLETLANSMSVALENALLFDETQRLLKETDQRAAELSIINSVQQGLASKLDMQSIYDLVGEKIREIFSADVVGISLYDRSQNLMRIPYML